MSEDWVRNFIGSHRQREAEKQQEQTKTRYAEASASTVFGKLRDRMKRDLKELHNAGLFPSLLLEDAIGQPQKFSVRQKTYPAVTLDVDLNLITIDYSYAFKRDDASDHERSGRKSLRIYADLRGSVQIYKNGTPFSDESEVSELLLKPLLDYIAG